MMKSKFRKELDFKKKDWVKVVTKKALGKDVQTDRQKKKREEQKTDILTH